ncbi:MAG TPA: alkane 1-monooxygenase [Saprospiraceae bacterium]|nr:alkane 1-monooxygenase [Saprospiraceae bacterium]
MKIGDIRYLAALLVPVTCLAGLYFGGWFSPGLLYFGFIIIPAIELFVPASVYSDDEDTLKKKSGKMFFDFLLYLNVPFLYFVMGYYIWWLGHYEWTAAEMIFSVFNVGVFLGVSGINVAHELGHRQKLIERWMAKLLLIPPLYSHFTLEHNYGHHLKVGTPEDPATARKNQSLYLFFIRSIGLGYRNAWRIGSKMIRSENKPLWMHEMIRGHFAQLILLLIVFFSSGFIGLIIYVCTALVGIMALESVNYIEHYGLVRKLMPSGRYEPMNATHSWNSNHELGRIVLFELVRHADHHYQTTRKYQTLRHLDESPQLPFGYPLSIMLALIPPIWFRVMNRRIVSYL